MPVFKVGKWTRKGGEVFDATKEVVDQIVASTKALKDMVIPFVVNHPKSESVTFGGAIANDVRVNNGIVEILPDHVSDSLAEQFNQKKFRGISVRLGDDRSIRHVGFLTDDPPAVRGLPEYLFSGEGETVIDFSSEDFGDYRLRYVADMFQKLRDNEIEKNGIESAESLFPQYLLDELKIDPPNDWEWITKWLERLQFQVDNAGSNIIFSTDKQEETVDKDLQAQLDAEKAKNAVLEQENAANKTKLKRTEFDQFCGSDEMKGRLTPAGKTIAADIFMAISGEDVLEFSGGEKTTVGSKFKSFLKQLPLVYVPGGVKEAREDFSGDKEEESEGKNLADAYNKSRGMK